MLEQFYSGTGKERAEEPRSLPPNSVRQRTDPSRYLADPGLIDAVNTALLLGQPLLLTGEPGTGKTLLASSLAWELGFGEPLVFQAKSTSRSRDLFYSFDALGRFQAAQAGVETKVIDYITYGALGSAILLSSNKEDVKDLLPQDFDHPGTRRSIVLIDEVDKAPRDFPNDILAELELCTFRIPELKNVKVSAPIKLSPVVIITSNSEKDLPDAFLRRCVYYDIPFPEPARLKEIIDLRLHDVVSKDSELLRDALDLFVSLRDDRVGLSKKPATAELLSWLVVLGQKSKEGGNPLRDDRESVRGTLRVLIKSSADQARAEERLRVWNEERPI